MEIHIFLKGVIRGPDSFFGRNGLENLQYLPLVCDPLQFFLQTGYLRYFIFHSVYQVLLFFNISLQCVCSLDFAMACMITRVRYIMLENSSIMLLSVTQKNLVLCPKLCSKNIALCSPDFYCIQHVLITTV